MGDFRALIEKILGLPAERFAQLEDFVDFLSSRGHAPAEGGRRPPDDRPPDERRSDERRATSRFARGAGREADAEDEIRAEAQALRDALRIWQDHGGRDRS